MDFNRAGFFEDKIMTDDKPDASIAKKDKFAEFKKELSALINRHSLEDSLEMPDFIMSELLVNVLRAMHLAHAKNNSWHEMEAYPEDYKDLKERKA